MTPIREPLLEARTAAVLLAARREGKSGTTASLDLGCSQTRVSLGAEGVSAEGLSASWTDLEEIAKEPRKVFASIDGEWRPVQVFSEETRWLRSLCPTETAPTVLVSGIPMHRIKACDPMSDTRAKVKALGTPRGRVLDTAMGLGYTAIEAAKTAEYVLTLEIDPAAVEIARWNPWSRALFESPVIELRVADAATEIEAMPANEWSAIIHDPPTIALGGDLYSLAFYEQLRRVLRRKGRLFHYVGDPNSGQGAKMTPGVMRRLSQAGFSQVQRAPEAFGVVATA
ncbi:MAG: methyltransferase [Fimbriimonadaceae bacterium]|nr:methyltransferase [Fimbriimonadaceae bacterium]